MAKREWTSWSAIGRRISIPSPVISMKPPVDVLESLRTCHAEGLRLILLCGSERERESVCERERECWRESVCVCVREREREGEYCQVWSRGQRRIHHDKTE